MSLKIALQESWNVFISHKKHHICASKAMVSSIFPWTPPTPPILAGSLERLFLLSRALLRFSTPRFDGINHFAAERISASAKSWGPHCDRSLESWLPSGYVNRLLLNMTIEIVDFPINNLGFSLAMLIYQRVRRGIIPKWPNYSG